ncbi:hypothetical protein K505DRAFT_374074 [Melanomma pulvis-pyrius CBS 109.77]|uniref:Uncharacterized protein n=1 Tax=Melanomma pulvis-pyrius CBS 109.77 TaxID=1314802 RepID=A0A6A6XFX9_9PLEO|nr:hypothetical protein K505DRAFT_374074 [Melanomma pulvis-pyrius CBS 109.77]
MPSSHDRRKEPAYVDDLESGRPRYPPPPREHRRRYEDNLDPNDALPRRRRSYRDPTPYPESDDDSPPPRRHRRREPRPVSDDESPPPRPRRREPRPEPPPEPRPERRQEPRVSPRPRPRRDDYEDDYPPPRRAATAPRPRREEDYYSDNRHDRPRRDPYDDDRARRDRRRDDRPRRDPYGDERAPRRRDDRYDGLEPRRSKSKKDAQWQQQALGMFKQYAVPVIKSEGTKFVTKQLGEFMAKQGKR